MTMYTRTMMVLCLMISSLAFAQEERSAEPEISSEKGLIELIYYGSWEDVTKANEIGVRGIPAVRINGKVFQIETETGFNFSAPRYPEILGFENVEPGMMATITYVTYGQVSYVQSMLVE